MAASYLEMLPQGGAQLFVDGKPFLMRAAELNNSSLSSRDFMRTVFPQMVDNNINTVLGSVSWQQVEAKEGSFDFTELTGIIEDARTHGIRLVLLWFGAFKNGKWLQALQSLLIFQASHNTSPTGSRRIKIDFPVPD
jgi:beta-galactosidase GanA